MARPFNTDWPLGKRMRELGLTVDRVQRDTGINYRTLSNMLANRVPIAGHNLHLLCEYLDVDAEDLMPDRDPEYPTTGAYVHKFPSQKDRVSPTAPSRQRKTNRPAPVAPHVAPHIAAESR